MAEQRVASAPVYEGSHRKKQANEVGFLGEVVAEEWFVSNGILFDDHRETTQEDYFIDEKYTLDVKTKDRTVKPALSYDNSVPLYNHEHQRPDYYLFISLLRDKKSEELGIKRFTEAYLVGGIDLPTLDRIGQKWEADQVDPSNGTKFWTACLNVSMERLIPMNKLVELWKR